MVFLLGAVAGWVLRALFGDDFNKGFDAGFDSGRAFEKNEKYRKSGSGPGNRPHGQGGKK